MGDGINNERKSRFAKDSCSICFVCPAELRDGIESVAKGTKRKNSDVIRAALFRYITSEKRRLDRKFFKDRQKKEAQNA